VLQNNQVRSFDTTLKFDRITDLTYGTNGTIVQQWSANTFFAANTIVSYNGVGYNVTANITTGNTFVSDQYTVVSANTFTNANDRIMAYYNPTNSMPAKDLRQLLKGIEYPGVQVTGLDFNQQPGFGGVMEVTPYDAVQYDEDGNPILSDAAIDTVISSLYTDSLLGLRPEDIDVDGGQYVDTYSSHAPEELVPGRIYDTLDMKVYTTVEISANVNAILGHRMFVNMVEETSFLRIADAFTTELAQELLYTDSEIVVVDASVLPVPNPSAAIPGVVFIGSERVTYYTIDTINNTLGQLRRGTQGTACPARHAAGAAVIDGSLEQVIPNVTLGTTALTSNTTYTVSNTVTNRLLLSGNVTANIGDLIYQNTSGAAAYVAGISSLNTSSLLVIYDNSAEFDFVSANVGPSSNLAINGTYTNTVFPISSTRAGFNLSASGTVTIAEDHLISATTGNALARLYGDVTGNLLVTTDVNQWYDYSAIGSSDSRFEISTTESILFLKAAPASFTTRIPSIPDPITTEDAVNIITEDGNDLYEEN
jgi:hypothetical protein